MNTDEKKTVCASCKADATPTNFGSSVCLSAYLPYRIKDIVFPDWVLNGSKQKIESLEKTFTECTSKTEVDLLVYRFVHESKNPFWTALHLCVTSADYTDMVKFGTKTLAHRIMKAFTDWLGQDVRRHHNFDSFLNEDSILISAFAAAFLQYSHMFYQLMYKTYRFSTHPALFLPYVRQSIEAKHFVKACSYVITLGLHDMYSMVDILFPLFTQSKTPLVYDYLEGSKNHQVQFVEFLDRMCGKSAAAASEVAHELQIPNVQEHLLEHKTLCNTVKKFATKFEVPTKHWPEVAFLQMASTLGYYMHRLYDDKDIPGDDWEDILVDFVACDERLQREAVALTHSHGDLHRALILARKFNFNADDDELPYDVRDALRQGNTGTTPDNPCTVNHVPISHYGIDDDYDDFDDDECGFGYENEDDDEDEELCAVAASAIAVVPNEKFYLPNLMAGNIHMVDKKEEYERCIREIEKNAKTIAIDCEWRFLYAENKHRLALIQLATEGHDVYLLDVLSLHHQLNGDDWGLIQNKLFKNPSIMKLGFSFNSCDWKMLAGVHTALANLSRLTMNFTDISTLCTNVLSQNPQLFNHYKGVVPKSQSLSTFAELCMGKPLDKTEKFSDWERRPLRPSQKLYAASDVCCLLDIYESLEKNCTSKGINLATFKGIKSAV